MKITMQNYEEWMIDYIEGNLTPEQEKAMHEFLAFHPELRAELELFNHTRLTPETVAFPDKAALKHEEPAGRVITMFSWVRYAAAAAAVVAVFIGIRYFGGEQQQQGIQRYAQEQYDSNSINRNTTKTSIIESPVKQQQQEYAQTTTPEKNNIKSLPKEEVKEQVKREINPIQGIDFASVDQIKSKQKDASLRDMMQQEPENEMVAMTDNQIKTGNAMNSTVISLNDNSTVVDWWVDAMAIGNEVGGVVNGVREAEINPFKKKEAGAQEVVKTKNINIPGFSYYSRKKTNH